MSPALKASSGPASIRAFEFERDYARVYALWQHAGGGINLRRSDEPEEILKKVRRDPDLFLVAEIESEIVGAVLGGFDGRRGMIYHLAVASEQRQSGIASMLMQELEHRLRSKGCIRAYLLVTPDNHTAMRFYENRGWQLMELHTYGKDLA